MQEYIDAIEYRLHTCSARGSRVFNPLSFAKGMIV